jgi:hypothetical protein
MESIDPAALGLAVVGSDGGAPPEPAAMDAVDEDDGDGGDEDEDDGDGGGEGVAGEPAGAIDPGATLPGAPPPASRGFRKRRKRR